MSFLAKPLGCSCMPAPRPWPKWRSGPVPRETGHQFAERGYLKEVVRTYTNGHYGVMVRPVETEWGLVEHALIARVDDQPTRNWNDLQRIKNELFGLERWAVEVFPPHEELVDEANMIHLWVLPAGMRLPFSLFDTYRRDLL